MKHSRKMKRRLAESLWRIADSLHPTNLDSVKVTRHFPQNWNETVPRPVYVDIRYRSGLKVAGYVMKNREVG